MGERVRKGPRAPRFVAFMLTAIVAVSVCNMFQQAYAQTAAKKKATAQKQSYTRPPLSRPIKPYIPDANRNREDKVFLEKADSLYANKPAYGESTKQVVKGNVVFRQGGTWMYCDSAYYYPENNSLDAFGNVKMQQGDTLYVYADKLFYDGNIRYARLRCGPTRKSVTLKNRNTTLTTDSLDYSLLSELGECNYGVEIVDDVNRLKADIGIYSARTKDADFFRNVSLVNHKDNFTMLTDTLYYNTDTHIASIASPTRILGENDTIITRTGWYNTATDMAELTSRSLIIHRDSTGNVTTLEGDSLIYDKATHTTRAFSFNVPGKNPQPMVLTDTANRMTLYGGYGIYNDSLQTAMATKYPLLIEYSRPDTIFLRADTIRTFPQMKKVFPPLTSFEIMQRDSILQADSIALVEWKNLAKTLQDSISATGNTDIIIPPAPVPTKWERDSAMMIEKDFRMALAYHRGRIFSQDFQGVADSLVYSEYDSLVYMYTKPVIWSDNRQIYGNEILIHLNDSTSDYALLPNYGLMAEHVEEDFYNQLTGKEIRAYFADKKLRRLEADGNVMTIVLPQENDSTYNKLVNAESSFLTVDMTDGTLDKLKMWPEVSGVVIPLFQIKRQQMYLPGFEWYEAIRPRREWYGDKWIWIDDLGEVPEALEKYFNEPAVTFGRRNN